MDETQETINEGNSFETGASSTQEDSGARGDDGIGLGSTVEDEEIIEEPTKDDDKKAEDELHEKAGDKDTDRYDKDPRFKEVITQRETEKEQRIRAEVERDFLRTQLLKDPKTAEPEVKPDLDYKDMSVMTEEELADWQADDPKGYLANLLRQAKAEVTVAIKTEMEQENAVKSQQTKAIEVLDNYAKENPTFDKMWETGDIQKFMRENPGHTAISAHIILTKETREKEIAEKARKETEETVRKNFKAKQNAKVIGQGPSVAGRQTEEDEVLKNTKEHGGVVSVLTSRLINMRRKANG